MLTVFLLALLTWQVGVRGPLLEGDEWLSAALRRSSPPTYITESFADLGNPEVALPVLVGAMAYVGWRTRALLRLLVAAAAMACVPLVVLLLKLWLDRPGPLGGTGYYPSGHAATSGVAFGGAALLLSWVATHRLRRWLVWAAVVLCLLNGLGLVWRSYHWPVDVLAGWCVSWMLPAAVGSVVRHAPRPIGRRRPVEPDRG